MAMCKSFFDYNCATFCGFPTVTLLGTLEDWQHLRQAAELAIRNLCQADGVVAGISRLLHMDFCERWLSALLPTLDRFIDAYQGQVDAVFWNSMLKRGGRAGSGGFTGYTGWFNVFFPKIKKSFNRFCLPYCDSADYAHAGCGSLGVRELSSTETHKNQPRTLSVTSLFRMRQTIQMAQKRCP